MALAQVLDADACELYTDVSGVFTTDPRVCAEARKLARISFDELMEMTAVGCPKPAMRSVEVAHRYGVPLHVRSAFTWEPGTWVIEEVPMEDGMEQAVMAAVVPDTSQAKVTITGVPDQPGIAARLFKDLAGQHVNVDMIVQNVSDHGVTDISFTVPREHLSVGEEVTEKYLQSVGAAALTTDANIGRVSVVGAGMASNPGVAAEMFEMLADNGINIEMISTSAIRISCVVAAAEVDRAVVALHQAFHLDGSPATG